MLAVQQVMKNLAHIRALCSHLDPVTEENFPVTHNFTDNSYIREITIPAGVIIVGKIHTHAHMNIVSGDCDVLTPVRKLTVVKHKTFESYAGEMKIVITKTPVTWSAIHSATTRDVVALEQEHTTDNYSEDLLKQLISSALQLGDKQCLGV